MEDILNIFAGKSLLQNIILQTATSGVNEELLARIIKQCLTDAKITTPESIALKIKAPELLVERGLHWWIQMGKAAADVQTRGAAAKTAAQGKRVYVSGALIGYTATKQVLCHLKPEHSVDDFKALCLSRIDPDLVADDYIFTVYPAKKDSTFIISLIDGDDLQAVSVDDTVVVEHKQVPHHEHTPDVQVSNASIMQATPPQQHQKTPSKYAGRQSTLSYMSPYQNSIQSSSPYMPAAHNRSHQMPNLLEDEHLNEPAAKRMRPDLTTPAAATAPATGPAPTTAPTAPATEMAAPVLDYAALAAVLLPLLRAQVEVTGAPLPPKDGVDGDEKDEKDVKDAAGENQD